MTTTPLASPRGSYKIDEVLGQSKYSELCAANDLKGKKVLVKKIDKTKIKPQFVKNEISACALVKHANIVKIYDQFEDKDFAYIVQEIIPGVDMFELLERNHFKPIREKHAKNLFRQLYKAVVYLHKKGIVHRDLKLENMVIQSNFKKVKIIDFGLCEVGKDCKGISTDWAGSPDYAAPEVLFHLPYTLCKADVWSLGVCLFSMLYAELPFSLQERTKRHANHESHPKLVFPENLSEPVSAEARDLISKMLTIDPSERPFLEELVDHPWMKKSISVSLPSFCSDTNGSTSE